MLRKINNENDDLSQFNELLVNSYFLRDPILNQIYKMSLPPKDAYLYFPKGEEIILPHKKPEKALRRIYTNVEFTQKEKEWLSEFKKVIASHGDITFPDFWNDGFNLAYIYSTESKLEKAYDRMVDYFSWLKKTFPMNIQPEDKIVKLLNTGFAYIYGRDHQFRPIIICQPYILQKIEKEYSNEDVVNSSIFLCQYMNNYMLIPGQIENWIMFVNIEKVSLLSIPDSIKKLIKTLSDYFIARLYKSYVLGLGGFLQFLYRIFCTFLEEITVRKFVILKNRNDPNLFQDINPQNLEERFGGQAQNCVYDEPNCLFPPRMPSQDYFKPNEDPNEILISEEDYIERYNNGNIPKESVSPFILERIKKQKKKKEKEEIAKKKREEALIKRNEAKTKAELNINTSWNTENELFDLDKFQTTSIGFLDGLKNFQSMKEKFCNNIMTLNEHVSNDENLD